MITRKQMLHIAFKIKTILGRLKYVDYDCIGCEIKLGKSNWNTFSSCASWCVNDLRLPN